MARVFAITTATTSLRLDSQGRAEGSFTVSNASGRPLRGRAELRATDPAQQRWLSIAAEPEREFPAAGTHQFSVKVVVPPGTPAGTCSFRLDAVSTQNPDEDFAEGPTVSFEVAASTAKKKPFPWWIVAAAALVIAGVGAYFLFRGGGKEQGGQQVTVPAVAGMTTEEAQSALLKNNLIVGQHTTRLVEGTATGTVLSQNPAAGKQAAPGAEVQLETALAGVKIPSVVGKTGPEAEKIITGASLRVGGPFLQQGGAGQDNLVKEERPAAGTLVPVNSPVDLYITMLIIKGVTVPKVGTSDRGAAEALIKSAGLQLGKVDILLTDDASKVGRVISQHPQDGAVVSLDSTVDLTVGQAGVKVPSVVGQKPSDAINIIQNAKLRPAPQERVDPSVGADRVTSQDPVADGRLVPPGTTISLVSNPPAAGVDGAGRLWRWTGSGWRQPTPWGVDSASHVWRWGGSGWQEMPGGLRQVSVAADGTAAGVNGSGQIYRWTGSTWAEIPRVLQKTSAAPIQVQFALEQVLLQSSGLMQVSAGSANNLWAVGPSFKVYHWTGSAWEVVGGALKHVSVGADATVWGVNNADQIFRWTGSGWQQIAGGLKQISVGNAQNIWGVSSAGQVYRWTGSGWQQLPGSLNYVSVTAQGMVMGTNSVSQIFLWTGSDWYRMPGGLVQVSAL